MQASSAVGLGSVPVQASSVAGVGSVPVQASATASGATASGATASVWVRHWRFLAVLVGVGMESLRRLFLRFSRSDRPTVLWSISFAGNLATGARRRGGEGRQLMCKSSIFAGKRQANSPFSAAPRRPRSQNSGWRAAQTGEMWRAQRETDPDTRTFFPPFLRAPLSLPGVYSARRLALASRGVAKKDNRAYRSRERGGREKWLFLSFSRSRSRPPNCVGRAELGRAELGLFVCVCTG